MAHSFDEQELAVASLYAEATHGIAARDGGAEMAAEILEEIGALIGLLDSRPELERLFTSPLVEAEERRGSLEKALRGNASDLLVDSLQVMNRKGRLGLVRSFAEAYRREHERSLGIVEVAVTTAVPLSDELRQRTVEATSKAVGATARLVETVDESLLGGMVIQVGDRKIDNSVSREIALLGERLHDRSSRELLSGKSYEVER